MAFLDNYRGTFRWHICFNFGMFHLMLLFFIEIIRLLFAALYRSSLQLFKLVSHLVQGKLSKVLHFREFYVKFEN
jgi:hypothetical protein